MGVRSLLDALRRTLFSRHAVRERRPVPVTLYTRPGCHLCEELVRRLAAAQLPVEYELVRVDIDTSAELTRLYGEKIPVLEVGGRLAFAGTVREERLVPRFSKLAERYLAEGPPPPEVVGRAARGPAE